MRVAIRADASLIIGSGHVMRCLVLADALALRGFRAHFICRAHPGHLASLISARGHDVTLLATDESYRPVPGARFYLDWLGTDPAADAAATATALDAIGGADMLVVDHYALDAPWHRCLCPRVPRIVVIDDLADRNYDCDVLLDQNAGRSRADYASAVTPGCDICTGPGWALLRPDFARLRSAASDRRRSIGPVRNVLITMGGVDPDDMTSRALEAIERSDLPLDCAVTVVMGGNAPAKAAVIARAAQMSRRTEVLVNVSNMPELMLAADIGIGAGGATSWERCCLGLPAIVIPIADNQLAIIDALVATGAATSIRTGDGCVAELAAALDTLVHAPDQRQEMSRRASALCDGGGTERFVGRLIGPLHGAATAP